MNETNQPAGEAAVDIPAGGTGRRRRRRAGGGGGQGAGELEQLPAGGGGVRQFPQAHRARDRQRPQIRDRALRSGAADGRAMRSRPASVPAPPTPGPRCSKAPQATLRQLQRAFDKAGIKIIDPAGQPFDPNWHEAMVAQESPDHPAEYGALGDPEGLFPERPAAAPGPGHRQQSRRPSQLKSRSRPPN